MQFEKHLNKNGVCKKYVPLLSGLRYTFKITMLCVAVFIATAQPAYSYIDPGTGSMIWQLLVSAFIGMSFYFRKAIAGVFSKFKKSDDR